MRIIDENDVKTWLDSKGLLNPDGHISYKKYEFSTEYRIPVDSGRKTALSRHIKLLFDIDGESLLWIDEWGIWGSSENMNLFYGFRNSLGENRPLIERPGHIFSKDDMDNVLSLLAMTFYFVWGAVVVPASAEFLIRISHDEFMDVYAKDEKVLSMIKKELEIFFKDD